VPAEAFPFVRVRDAGTLRKTYEISASTLSIWRTRHAVRLRGVMATRPSGQV